MVKNYIQLDYDFIPASEQDLPNLLFIHGAGGDKTLWEEQIIFFKKIGWGVITLSLPGHGKSPISDTVTIDRYTEEISNLIVNLKLKRIILVGHSMGGAISLQIVLQNHKLDIDSLVLIGTGASIYVNPIVLKLIETDINQAFELISKFAYGKRAQQELKERNENIMRQTELQILYDDFKECSLFDVRKKLIEITIPTLIICGEDDKMIPVNNSYYLHEQLSNSQITLIPEAGHFVFQETSVKVNEVIFNFINENT